MKFKMCMCYCVFLSECAMLASSSDDLRDNSCYKVLWDKLYKQYEIFVFSEQCGECCVICPDKINANG